MFLRESSCVYQRSGRNGNGNDSWFRHFFDACLVNLATKGRVFCGGQASLESGKHTLTLTTQHGLCVKPQSRKHPRTKDTIGREGNLLVLAALTDKPKHLLSTQC